jgi:two-component system CheB/CheR fusion protein
MRILVVDDDTETRDVVALMLEGAGGEVRSAASVAEAIRMFGEFHPQVLLADLSMPLEDGFSLIRKVRALRPREGGDVPSIALSALAGDEDRQRSLNSGFQLHLVKPVDTDHLARAVLDVTKTQP